MAGFFDDETTKKPVVAAPVVVQQAVPDIPFVAPIVPPAKFPAEVLINEVAPLAVAENAIADSTGEKLAEQVPDLETAATVPEKVESVPESVNEIIPVVEGEILEPAASEIVASELPAIVTQAASVPESPVAAIVSSAPVKQTSEEEEGLIEGIVNTLILDDGDGDLKNNYFIETRQQLLISDEDDTSDELLRVGEKKKPVDSDEDDDGK